MKWILIMTLWAGRMSGGVAIHSVEFNTEKACIQAREFLIKEKQVTTAVCTPKGEVL